MKIIVAAAGSSTRWNNHLGIPKQLVPVDGVPIIHRTQSLFDVENSDKVLLAVDERMLNTSTGFVMIEPGNTADTILPNTAIGHSYRYWDPTDGTLLLFGDVFFTDAAKYAILSMVKSSTDVTWIGRLNGSVSKGYRELFGIYFPASKIEHITDSINKLREWRETQQHLQHAGGWFLLLIHLGIQDFDELTFDRCRNNFLEINDETDDFDYPDEYTKWLARYRP